MHEAPMDGLFSCPFQAGLYFTWGGVMKILKRWAVAAIGAVALSGCTVLAIADAAGSAVVYGVKTTVNVLDAITPDIVNKK